MATHYLPLLNWTQLPDNSGQVYPQPLQVAAVNDRWRHLAWVFENSGVENLIYGSFRVPAELVANAKIQAIWTANIADNTRGVYWQFRYRCVSPGASLDQLGQQEDLNVTASAPGTAFFEILSTINLTTANLVPGSIVQWEFSRDSGVAGDTMAASALLFGLYLDFDDQ